MKKMKKIITTKQIRRWQKIDRLVFAVPLIIFLHLSVVESDGRYLWKTVMNAPSPDVVGAAILILVMASAFLSVPVILLWRAISHTAKRALIRNATFQTDLDFDYYREKLTGIAPTTISLLMDLQIETKKDVAALLLKYVKMGAVSIEGRAVRVLDSGLPGLLPSDRTLLDLIARNQAQPVNLGGWKRQATMEAIQSGNLRQRGARQSVNSMSRSCLTGCLSGCLLPIVLFFGMGLGAGALLNSSRMERLNRFLDGAPDLGQIDYFLSSPDMMVAIALMFILLLVIFASLWLPITALLRVVSSASHEVNGLRRTEAGEILTAQIWGLKNFLRDYSNLSMAEKEQLLLWDDFLIYAVVLEENERIVEDIFRMKNLRYQDFMLF